MVNSTLVVAHNCLYVTPVPEGSDALPGLCGHQTNFARQILIEAKYSIYVKLSLIWHSQPYTIINKNFNV